MVGDWKPRELGPGPGQQAGNAGDCHKKVWKMEYVMEILIKSILIFVKTK